jgi:hypothetical protein
MVTPLRVKVGRRCGLFAGYLRIICGLFADFADYLRITAIIAAILPLNFLTA